MTAPTPPAADTPTPTTPRRRVRLDAQPVPATARRKESGAFTVKFTPKNVFTFEPDPDGGQRMYRDSQLPGFVLVVGKTARSFGVHRRIKGSKTPVYRVIGKVEHWTTEKARERATDMIRDMTRGIDPREVERAEQEARDAKRRETERLSRTLREVVTEYQRVREMRASTITQFAWLFGTAPDAKARKVRGPFVEWMDRPVAEITREAVSAKFESIRAGVAKRHEARRKADPSIPPKPDAGKSMANGAMIVLRAVCEFARVRRWIEENPVRVIADEGRWHAKKRKTTHIKPHGWRAFMAAIEQVRKDPGSRAGADYVEWLAITGCRKTEAALATFDWVDFEGRTFTIPPEVAKNGQEHVIPLTDRHVQLLKRRYDENEWLDYVFPAPTSPRKPFTEARPIIEKIIKAGAPKFTPHDLRRSFITVAESLELSPYTLARLLNHVSGTSSVTAGYIQVAPERVREAMEKVVAKIAELSAPEVAPLRITNASVA